MKKAIFLTFFLLFFVMSGVKADTQDGSPINGVPIYNDNTSLPSLTEEIPTISTTEGFFNTIEESSPFEEINTNYDHIELIDGTSIVYDNWQSSTDYSTYCNGGEITGDNMSYEIWINANGDDQVRFRMLTEDNTAYFFQVYIRNGCLYRLFLNGSERFYASAEGGAICYNGALTEWYLVSITKKSDIWKLWINDQNIFKEEITDSYNLCDNVISQYDVLNDWTTYANIGQQYWYTYDKTTSTVLDTYNKGYAYNPDNWEFSTGEVGGIYDPDSWISGDWIITYQDLAYSDYYDEEEGVSVFINDFVGDGISKGFDYTVLSPDTEAIVKFASSTDGQNFYTFKSGTVKDLYSYFYNSVHFGIELTTTTKYIMASLYDSTGTQIKDLEIIKFTHSTTTQEEIESWEEEYNEEFDEYNIDDACSDLTAPTSTSFWTSAVSIDFWLYTFNCGFRKAGYWAFKPRASLREKTEETKDNFLRSFPFSLYPTIKNTFDPDNYSSSTSKFPIIFGNGEKVEIDFSDFREEVGDWYDDLYTFLDFSLMAIAGFYVLNRFVL